MEFWRVVHVLTLPLYVWACWLLLKNVLEDNDGEPIKPNHFPWLVGGLVCLFVYFLLWQLNNDPIAGAVLNLIAIPAIKGVGRFFEVWNAFPAVRRYKEHLKSSPTPPAEQTRDFVPELKEKIIRIQLNAGRVLADPIKAAIEVVLIETHLADDQAVFWARRISPKTAEQFTPEQSYAHYDAAFTKMFAAYFEYFPTVHDSVFFRAPITSVLPVGPVISEMLRATVWDRQYGCFEVMYKTVNDHAWGVTRKFLTEKEIAAGKKIWPNTYPGDASEIPDAYLRDTPLAILFNNRTLPVALKPQQRLEHMFVLAPSGSGKTQLMQSMITRDLERVAAGEASIVVIDSQGVNRRKTDTPTLVENLIHLQLFAKEMKGKLTYIRPSADLAFNLLDMGQNDPNLSDEQRQVRKTAAREVVLTALGSGSDLQYQMLAWCLRLAMSSDTVPTIRTLRRIMAIEDAKKFAEEFKGLLARADNLTREYFQHLHRGARNTTREALISRIDGLFTEDTFREMLQKPTNDFRMIDEIEAGKVIVIDADKSLLGERGAEAFGRFFLAQLLYASRQRQSTKPVYVYIDECQDFISDDENISKLLVQARKNDIGLILATQNLTNIHSPVVRENMQGVAITVTHNEERRGVMNLKLRGCAQPIEVQLDYGAMEKMPRMTEEQFAEVHRPKAPPPPPQLIPQPLKPATNDDDVIH